MFVQSESIKVGDSSPNHTQKKKTLPTLIQVKALFANFKQTSHLFLTKKKVSFRESVVSLQRKTAKKVGSPTVGPRQWQVEC